MTTYDCPLCSGTYGARTDLRVHLEVEHRKSEIVSQFVTAVVLDDPDESESVEDDRPIPTP